MASTNKTVTLGLSQFIATDKASWQTDYNSDMEKIDNFAAGVDGKVSQAVSDATSAKASAQTASTAAQQAQTAAQQAQNTATAAQSTAGQAQTTAQNALNIANAAAKSIAFIANQEVNSGNTWIDNKPIFYKIISSTTGAASTAKYISIGASVDTFIFAQAIVKGASSSSSPASYIIPSYSSAQSGTGAGRVMNLYGNDATTNQNSIELTVANNTEANKPVIIFIAYTKV